MKYNRALDLLAAAAVFASEGKPNSAAKAFTAAVKCPSLTAALRTIEASNKKAYTKASSQMKADTGIDAENPGEEFREEPSENGDRVVQEATTAKALRAQARKLMQKAAAIEDADQDDVDDLTFLDGEDTTADADGDMDLTDEDLEDDGGDFTASASFIKAFGQRAAKAPAAAPAKVSAAAFARAVKNIEAVRGK